MNRIKRIFGIVWLILAVVAAWFCIFGEFGLSKLTTGKQDDLVFGIIMIFILTPLIVFGLGLFGYYALIGEYDKQERKE